MIRLLVIDDEPGIQHSFRRAFASPDFQVETAGRADAGAELMRTWLPDVVVMDGALNLRRVFVEGEEVDVVVDA